MPLTLAGMDSVNKIVKVRGKAETKKFLENLGFVPGAQVRVLSESNGNLIVNVKDCRVAVGREMAAHISVE